MYIGKLHKRRSFPSALVPDSFQLAFDLSPLTLRHPSKGPCCALFSKKEGESQRTVYLLPTKRRKVMATLNPGGKRHMCYYYDGMSEQLAKIKQVVVLLLATGIMTTCTPTDHL